MELSYEYLYNQTNKESLDKLFESSLDLETTLKIRRIHYKFEREFKILQREFQRIVMEHSEKDEKGNLICPPGSGEYKIDKEKLDKFNSEIKELMSRKIDLEKCKPINVSEIKDVKLSSFDLQALDPILEGLDL